MPLTRTCDLVGPARERGVGVGAFNVITLEHAEANVRGDDPPWPAVAAQASTGGLGTEAGPG